MDSHDVAVYRQASGEEAGTMIDFNRHTEEPKTSQFTNGWSIKWFESKGISRTTPIDVGVSYSPPISVDSQGYLRSSRSIEER